MRIIIDEMADDAVSLRRKCGKTLQIIQEQHDKLEKAHDRFVAKQNACLVKAKALAEKEESKKKRKK